MATFLTGATLILQDVSLEELRESGPWTAKGQARVERTMERPNHNRSLHVGQQISHTTHVHVKESGCLTRWLYGC